MAKIGGRNMEKATLNIINLHICIFAWLFLKRRVFISKVTTISIL